MPRSQKETFEVIFEACQEGILVVNNEGTIVLANRAGNAMFGYEHDELTYKNIESLIPKNVREKHVAYRKEYDKHPTPRKMGVGRDLKGVRKNGEEFPVEVSLNRAILKNMAHTVAFIIDISERKKMEEALKRSEEQLISYAAQLENRVRERTEELDRTIKTLEKTNENLEEQVGVRIKAENEAKKALDRERELNELKSRFVSMASHEFRTPLSTMLSSASLAERYSDQKDRHKRERHIEKIKTAIANLKGILDDFLSLSKLEEGKISINMTMVNIGELVESVIDQMTPLTGENQQIHILTKGKEVPLLSDPKILNNVLINLISNSIKYSEKDIELILTFTDSVLNIKVKDQGIGIPEEDQKHMFERFFRANNATNIQGTGLGLNIVKKYTDLLGGSIDFTSKMNMGTTFIVNLPLVQQPIAEKQEPK